MVFRLPPHAQWIEAVVSHCDAVVLEAMGLGEVVGDERGRAVLAHDDTAAVRAAIKNMSRAQ